MIEIQNLRFSYAGSKHKVFDDLCMTLESDCIYGLLGKNGQGKSTLLYLISGLLRPKNGTILFENNDTKKRLPETLREIFIVPEEYTMPQMSVKSFIEVNKSFYPRFSEAILYDCLKDFDLPELSNLKTLSMGQKKKVYMSFALAARTRLLLMDEPTNGLDIPSKSLFRKVISKHMTKDRTLIISTHQVHDVESLLDHILILDNARLKLNASVADITQQYRFEFRQPSEMDDNDILYAEPSLQGNAVIARRKAESPETNINLELFFNAVTKGAISINPSKNNPSL